MGVGFVAVAAAWLQRPLPATDIPTTIKQRPYAVVVSTTVLARLQPEAIAPSPTRWAKPATHRQFDNSLWIFKSGFLRIDADARPILVPGQLADVGGRHVRDRHQNW